MIISGLYIVLWGKGKEMNRANQVIMPAASVEEYEGGVVEIPRNSSTRSVVIVDPNSNQILETESLDRNVSIRRCSSAEDKNILMMIERRSSVEKEKLRQEKTRVELPKPGDDNV